MSRALISYIYKKNVKWIKSHHRMRGNCVHRKIKINGLKWFKIAEAYY